MPIFKAKTLLFANSKIRMSCLKKQLIALSYSIPVGPIKEKNNPSLNQPKKKNGIVEPFALVVVNKKGL
jgi:hypothetical protein